MFVCYVINTLCIVQCDGLNVSFLPLALQNTLALGLTYTFCKFSPHLHSSFPPRVSGCQMSQPLQCIIPFLWSGQSNLLIINSEYIV